jgi:hypothetical protein
MAAKKKTTTKKLSKAKKIEKTKTLRASDDWANRA